MADRRRQGGGFCCAISCTNARNKISCEGKSFFKFPKDEERCKKWVQYARRQDLMNKPPSSLHSRGYLLCSDHFEENQFLRPAERDRLVWNAVPTIFNVPNPPLKATSTRRKLDKPAAPDKAKRKLSTQTEVMASQTSDSIPRDLVHSEFVHISQEHDSYLRRKLYKQWQDLQHCDLTLAVKDGELRAHACVVTAFSPKLKSVLETATHASPATGGVYVQLLFEVGVLRCLLNMMYTGVLSFNTAMLASVLSAARWLQMEEVVQLCQEYREVTGAQGDSSALTDDLVSCEVDSSDPRLLGISAKGDEHTEVASTEQCCNNGCRTNEPKSNRKRGRPMKVVAQPRQPARAKGRSVKRRSHMFLDASQVKQENDGSDTPNTNNLQVSSLEEVNEKGAFTLVFPLGIKDAGADSGSEKPPVTAGKKKQGRQSSPNESAEMVIKAEKPLLEKDDGDKGSRLLSNSEWVEMEEFPSSDEMDFTLGKTDSIRCKKCRARFSNPEKYRQHIVNHPVFICDICSVTYHRKSSLTRHMSKCHFTEPHLTCPACSFVAKTLSGLRTHCKEVHQESKPFKCKHPGCSYTTWKLWDFLHRHSVLHSGVKQCICDKCGQGFAHQDGLMSHHKACYQLQQFLCDLCGKSFNHVQSMRAHRRTVHFGEKPYSCESCGNRFSDQHNLKRHMRIHDNAYPYECEICKKKYRHSNSLKAHLKIHGDSAYCGSSVRYKVLPR
ncbi:hypothetical protein BaRGS_00036224 [Batillaria attramentaria]|uniref:Uncharacterized protein n=1 Tax=Batillaria attramentaria TaxID=370345 RepID=A0ABD0JCI2_9CAEN